MAMAALDTITGPAARRRAVKASSAARVSSASSTVFHLLALAFGLFDFDLVVDARDRHQPGYDLRGFVEVLLVRQTRKGSAELILVPELGDSSINADIGVPSEPL